MKKQPPKKSPKISVSKKSRRSARQASKRIQDLSQAIEIQRSQAYERPRLAKPVGRRVKVVATGDSWFHYTPASWDVLSQLRRNVWSKNWVYDVEDTAKAGATLNEMVYGRTMIDTYQLIQQHPDAEVFLFSGGKRRNQRSDARLTL